MHVHLVTGVRYDFMVISDNILYIKAFSKQFIHILFTLIYKYAYEFESVSNCLESVEIC